MNKTNSGFTIVELLIVIVVIAILAAISIVAYNGIQNRANDSIVKSDLSQVAKKLEHYKVLNGTYPSTSSSQLVNANLSFSKSSYDTSTNNGYRDNTSDNYSFVARTRIGQAFMVSSSDSSVKDYNSGWAAANICPATGFSDYAPTAAHVGGSWNTTWVN